jgi:cysteinyl-tRNA synthetase
LLRPAPARRACAGYRAGHARVYVAFDILYRLLSHLGYDVRYVRNFTDVDDKIIARGAATGEPPLELSRRFIGEFHADMDALGCLRPALEPLATQHIPAMVAAIERILAHGHAYAAGGDVYFDVASLPGYGALSGRSGEDNRAGERVAVDGRKRGAADFALWKAAKPGEPTWASPWGPGRPGWHIECSAMINELMGPVIDIHGGGRDLVFPHHENELAQARAAEAPCGCGGGHPAAAAAGGEDDPPFVRYWLHNGFVNVDAEKMSKSLGNFFTIRDVLKNYPAAALRWFLVGTQYRQGVNYTQRALEEAADRVYYLYQALADADQALAAAAAAAAGGPPEAAAAAAAVRRGEGPGGEVFFEVLAALADDMNTPLAVAALSAPLKAMNDLLHTKAGRKRPDRAATLASLAAALRGALDLLGLAPADVGAALEELRAAALARAGLTEGEVAAAIEERAAARAAKDYAASDAVRERLEAVGVAIMDTPAGTTWKPAPRLAAAEEGRGAQPAGAAA